MLADDLNWFRFFRLTLTPFLGSILFYEYSDPATVQIRFLFDPALLKLPFFKLLAFHRRPDCRKALRRRLSHSADERARSKLNNYILVRGDLNSFLVVRTKREEEALRPGGEHLVRK